jgi:spectinomycin phosphotransferase
MRAPAVGVDPQDLAEAAADRWGLTVDRLWYVPEGGGSYHWLAQTSDGARYFLTADDLDVKLWIGDDRESAFLGLGRAFGTALALSERAGLRFVVPPIPAADGQTLHRLSDRYSLAVFPFISGQPGHWGDTPGRTDRDWLLRMLAEMHRASSQMADRAPAHDLRLVGRAGLEDALADLDRPWTGGPFSEPARRQLRMHAQAVTDWLGSFDELSAVVAPSSVGWVISHGEPHPGNLIRVADGFRLIDWDTVAFAPAERDLWMFDDGSAGSLALYSQITGRPVSKLALAFYRLGWALADLASFISLLRSGHQENRDTGKAWQAVQLLLSSPMSALHLPYRW